MKEEIIELIAQVLEVDEGGLNEKTNLAKDLNIESLDLIDLIVAFQEKYAIEIPDNEIKNFQTIGDIIKFVEKHVN